MADTTVDTTATTPGVTGILHNSNDPVSEMEVRAAVAQIIPKASEQTIKKIVSGVKTWGQFNEFTDKGLVNKKPLNLPHEEMTQLGSANDVPLIGGGLKVGAQALKALFTKKAAEVTAEEGATVASKTGAVAAVGKFAKSHKKLTTAALGVGGLSVVGNFMPDSKSKSTTTTADSSSLTAGGKTAQASLDAMYASGVTSAIALSQAISTMQANGTKLSQADINALQTRYQITLTSADTSATTVGVYLGGATPEVKGTTKIPGKAGLEFPTITPAKSGLVDMIKYKQSFPIGDPAALNAFAKKVSAAGYSIGGNDPIGQLRTIWDNLGQASMDASRQGKQMTPDQVLALAAGLGGGGSTGPTVNTTYSPTSKEDVKKMLNTQLQKLTGRTASNDDLEAFYNKVHGIEMKKGTKTVTTTVGKNSKTVVTPGYGQSEILAEAEKVAQQDPMYKQLQSSNVFGDALSQALGVK